MLRGLVVDPLTNANAVYAEFWRFAAEMPDEAMPKNARGKPDLTPVWRLLFEALYDPGMQNPVVDSEGRPIRSTEFICRSWKRMESMREGEEVIKKFRGLAGPAAAKAMEAGFIPLVNSAKAGDDGRFEMGALDDERGDSDERPRHPVVLTRYALHAYCVTNVDYERFDRRHAQHRWWAGEVHPAVAQDGPGADDECPVVMVSWYDAFCYAKWLGTVRVKIAKDQYVEYEAALPTEAQWEYACRCFVGRETAYSFGGGRHGRSATPDVCNFDGNHLWPEGTRLPKMPKEDVYRKRTLPVKWFEPKEWGFYQMHGNVWEWCWDWFAANFYNSDKATKENPMNDDAASHRVLRGGSWNFNGWDCRSAYRSGCEPGGRIRDVGFRLAAVLVLEPRQASQE